MGGGLMQIVTYGAEDLSLTGNPQITFFHTVYRRYTNFGKKFIELSFDNSPNFNTTSYLNIPKNNGDLLTKLILKIKLPKINLSYLNNLLNINNSSYDVNVNISYYNYYKTFCNNLKNIIRIFFEKYNNVVNYVSYIQDLKKYILKFVNIDEYNQFFYTINYFFNNDVLASKNTYTYDIDLYTNASLFKIINENLIYIYEKYTNDYMSYDGFKFTIQKNIDILDELDIEIYNSIINNTYNNNKIKICWVNKIAIYLFNSIDFYIGSNKIYSLSDTYINNYSELYYKNKELYNRLIGNNIYINKFQEIIDEEILYLPIPFWNLSNYGLAFPLISLQYNSLQIKINTKKFLECIRIDTGINTTVDNNKIIDLIIENYDSIIDTDLEITMLNELIFLDSIERNKFARSAHEYLIEQVQEIDFNKISSNNNTIQLDIFHCCKDMFWFIQKNSSSKDIFSKNINVFNYIYPTQLFDEMNVGQDKIDVYKYSLTLSDPKYLFNPFVFNQGLYVINNDLKYLQQLNTIVQYISNKFVFPSATIELNKIILQSYFYLNGTQLFGENSNYFNYLQPYAYYNSTPQIGLNTYSFCLSPIEFQPTGSCNMSRISYIGLKLKINDKINDKFNSEFINPISVSTSTSVDDEYKLTFQTRNFNVLRIIGGIGATAYTYN
jgi:hypothetical protein